jgi:hypothetical protein
LKGKLGNRMLWQLASPAVPFYVQVEISRQPPDGLKIWIIIL